MKILIWFFTFSSLLPLVSCQKSEMPLQRQEEYKGSETSGQKTPANKEDEVPVRKGVFDEGQEDSLELKE